MGSFLQDVKYGVRMLANSPGFTIVTVITLALGIGANTAMFSAVNGILLRPLPYKDSSRLVDVWGNSASYPGFRMTLSVPEFNDVKAQSHSFERIAAYRLNEMNWTGHGDPEVVSVTEVSQDVFATLGVSPARGRAFTPDEEVLGKDNVVILSDALWHARFSGDTAVLGKTITLDNSIYTVVGIMPQGFQFQSVDDNLPQLWKPFAPSAKIAEGRTQRQSLVIARLRRGVSLRQAQEEAQTIAARMDKDYPKEDEGQGLFLTTMKQGVVADVRPALLVLLAAVGFVLLIACVNVANLFLARSWKRRREIAVRAVLGATRARLIRQLLVESVLLAIAGGSAGLALGTWGVDIMRRFAPADTPRLAEIGLDYTVFWFTLSISVLTGIAFGLAPALHSSRTDLSASLKDSVAISGSSYNLRGHHRLRSLLVVSEVALAVVLMIGAALMLKSFSRLTHSNPGFRTDHALTAEISLPETKYNSEEKQREFFNSVLSRIQNLPGVQNAALMTMPLLGDYLSMTPFSVEGQPAKDSRYEPYFEMQVVSPDYFQAAGIPLLAGRAFGESDTKNSPGVVIVNETLARRYWPAGQAIGQRLSRETDKDGPLWLEIVAVAGDTRDVSLTHTSQSGDLSSVFTSRFGVHEHSRPCQRRYQRARACAPRCRLVRRSRSTGSIDRDARSSRCAFGSRAEIPHAAARHFCRAGPGHHAGRNLRRHVLFRQPAHARDRNSHGPGRAIARRAPPGSLGGHEAGARWARDRNHRRASAHARAHIAAIRGSRHGSRNLCRSRQLARLRSAS